MTPKSKEISLAVAATVIAASSTATASATASAAVTATSPSSTTAVTASTAATSATAFALRARLVDNKGAAEKLLAVERCNGLFGLGVVAHFRESETSRLSCKPIAKKSEGIRLNTDFGEKGLDIVFGSLERQIADVQFLHDRSPCAPVNTVRRFRRG
jgi:hypothetical protein